MCREVWGEGLPVKLWSSIQNGALRAAKLTHSLADVGVSSASSLLRREGEVIDTGDVSLDGLTF